MNFDLDNFTTVLGVYYITEDEWKDETKPIAKVLIAEYVSGTKQQKEEFLKDLEEGIPKAMEALHCLHEKVIGELDGLRNS